MSRYDGLVIPRSYSEYINKTDAATLQQALQLSGVLSGAVAAGDNKAVTSNAVSGALVNYPKLEHYTPPIEINSEKEIILPKQHGLLYIYGWMTSGYSYCQLYLIFRNPRNGNVVAKLSTSVGETSTLQDLTTSNYAEYKIELTTRNFTINRCSFVAIN